jgi:hypothetical protein
MAAVDWLITPERPLVSLRFERDFQRRTNLVKLQLGSVMAILRSLIAGSLASPFGPIHPPKAAVCMISVLRLG